VARGSERPSWAPLVDERFARLADTFALVTLGFAAIYIVVMIVSSVGDVLGMARLAPAGTAGLMQPIIRELYSVVSALAQAFILAGGALIIQALVIIATREYPSSPGTSPGESNDPARR
jgi:hypothetical protein